MASGSKTDSKKHEIFVSYAREDQDRVEPIVEELRAKRNHEVFWDRDIKGGQDWEQTIIEKLKEVQAVLVCWSRHSIGNKNVRSEASRAFEKGKYFPVLIGDLGREDLQGLPLGMEKTQWINLVPGSRDTRAGEMAILMEQIEDFIEDNRQKRAAAQRHTSTVAPDPALDEYEERLVKHVNRDNQMGRIRALRRTGQRRAVFLFHCIGEDWPTALAGQLASEDCKDGKEIPVRLKSGLGRDAFRTAMEGQDLNRSGNIVVIYLMVNLNTSESMVEIRDFLQGVLDYLASPDGFTDDRSVYVLFACMGGRGRLERLRRWRIRRRLSELKRGHCEWLNDLGAINSGDVEAWINRIEEQHKASYDTDAIRAEIFEEILPTGKEMRHLPLGVGLRGILARRRR